MFINGGSCHTLCGADARANGNRLVLLFALFLLLAMPGCSRNDSVTSEDLPERASEFPFVAKGDAAHCSAQCRTRAIGLARATLGLDPEDRQTLDGDLSEVFESLQTHASWVGATVTRTSPDDVIERLSEGPSVPVILVDNHGHLYALFGAIRVNDQLLCQLLHGDEAVSLIAKPSLLEAGFREAWRLENKSGTGTPIHIGAATIEVDKLWQNFGEVLPDKPLECVFHLKNTGDKSVIVDKPRVSCQCTVPSLTERTELAAGKSLDLQATIRPTGTASLRSFIRVLLYEKGTGASRDLQLALIGSQRESMEITPNVLDFGLVAPGSPCSRLISLREKPTDRFRLKEVDPGELPITHNVDVSRDRDGLAIYRIQLQLNLAEGSAGEQQHEITLTTDSYLRPTITIPVRFQIEAPVRVIPSVISLGTLPVGELREQRVQFFCRHGELVDARIESQPKECSITVHRETAFLEMVVAVRLEEVGIWQGMITGKVVAGAEEYPIAIKCAGYGQR